MAWNEPGRGGKDPWGRRNGKQGPPDLDELLRKFRKRLRGFGSGGRGPGMGSVLILVAVLIVAWLVSGFYEIGSAQRGLALWFGAYRGETVGPGLHWQLPYPFQSVIKVDVDTVRSTSYRSLMLTQDHNLVNVDVAAQYRVTDPTQYAFNVRDPEETLRQVVRSSIRAVVGETGLKPLLGTDRSGIAEKTQSLAQKVLDSYGTGLRLTSLTVQDVQPPEPVQKAFADVDKAQEDEQHAKDEASAYVSRILSEARGDAASQVEQARAYKTRTIDRAQGEADRFSQVLAQYQQTPQVTRSRMYLDAMDQVLTRAGKVLIGVDKSNPVLYLPLERLFASAAPGSPKPPNAGEKEPTPSAGANGSSSSSGGAAASSADELRTRTRSR